MCCGLLKQFLGGQNSIWNKQTLFAGMRTGYVSFFVFKPKLFHFRRARFKGDFKEGEKSCC